MRAPPQPRRSRHRYIFQVVQKFHDTVGLQRVKRRWHLHKVHKASRSNSRTTGNNAALKKLKDSKDGNKKKNKDAGAQMNVEGSNSEPNSNENEPGINDRNANKDANNENDVPNQTPIRLEDIANQPSAIESPKKRRMPLLIASFPKGYSSSPSFKVLEKNNKSRFLLSRRRYKLKTFNGGCTKTIRGRNTAQGTKRENGANAGVNNNSLANKISDTCQQGTKQQPTTYTIRKDVIKHAQMKVNYHRKGVVNSTCVLVNSELKKAPEYLNFGKDCSIRLNDYPSLSLRKPDNNNINQIQQSRQTPALLNTLPLLQHKAPVNVRSETLRLQPVAKLDAPDSIHRKSDPTLF